jgi:hypothetical protein
MPGDEESLVMEEGGYSWWVQWIVTVVKLDSSRKAFRVVA